MMDAVALYDTLSFATLHFCFSFDRREECCKADNLKVFI